MANAVPEYYHTLDPFLEMFQTGTPILMYHKVGVRPPGVRLKGLYVSPTRFARQLAELHQAGFSSVDLTQVGRSETKRHIVLTFDDGFRNVFQNALEPMSRHGFRAIQFLVPNFIGKCNQWDLRDGEAPETLMDTAQIKEWLAAGHEIGSHSLSHVRLTRLSVRDAREEVFASKKALEDTFGLPIRHFCYPYGDWNESVRDLVIEAGYQSACTTIFGVNRPSASSFALSRIGVRYPSRSLRALKDRLFQ